MMRRYLLVLGVLMLALVSCTKEEVVGSQVKEGKVVLLTQIEQTNAASRAEVGIDGKGKFVEGDKISLLIDERQMEQTLSGGKWTPEVSWSDFGASASFSGFYPLVPQENLFTHTVSTDQRQGKNFENSDLLYAASVTVNNGEVVKLDFNHLMSCVTVVLKSNVYTEEQLAKATVKIRGYNKIDVRYYGALSKLHDYDYDRSNMSDIIFKNQGNGVYQAVMCPQDVHKFSYSVWWLMMNINGKDYYVSEPPKTLKDGSAFKGFESGKNVTFTYSFYDIDERFANKTFWVDGVKGIPDPSSKEWKPIAVGSKLKYLPWKQEYGWYDCHKRDPAGPSEDDHNLCWAATTSNMIHWWMDRNSENIRQYCELNNKNFDEIPHKYISHHDSEVFQLFRDKFEDKGGFVRQGLNWYFLGKYVRESDAADLINPKVPSGGYFKDVFDVNSNMFVHRGIVDLSTLNSALKDAFLYKQAIGFAVWMSSFNGGHAMTIWGAKFDENGDACAIYYVDNNDGPLKETPVGLIEARVGEYEGDSNISAEMRRRIYLENSYGKRTIEIQDMTFLDQRKSDWDAYFSKHSK